MKMMTTPNAAVDTAKESGQEPINAHYDTRLRDFPWSRRMQIPIIAAAVYSVIRTLGPTLRFEVLGWRNAEQVHAAGHRAILTFWHQGIFSATWWWRNRGIVVLNSTNFDGQWTRKVIEWLGYGTAQGSSSRGGLRGLAVMAQKLEEGRDCAFTIDGPHGPRHIAKPGPAMLARRTGFPIVAFHIALCHARTLTKTWDHFQFPYPFSRAVLLVAPPIYVARDANRDVLAAKQQEMQRELERVREVAESWFSLSGAERDKYRIEFGE